MDPGGVCENSALILARMQIFLHVYLFKHTKSEAEKGLNHLLMLKNDFYLLLKHVAAKN